MDAQQGTYISPDGRHRWDPQAQRWVPVEVSAAPPAGPGSGALEPPVEPEPMGGWGRPVAPARATAPVAPAQPWGAEKPPPWGAAPSPWAAPPGTPGYAPAWQPRPRQVAQGPAPPAVGGAVAALGGLALIVGAFLAWIAASYQGVSISQKGVETPSGDGWFFVVCGAVVAIIALLTFVAPKLWLGLLLAAGALSAAGVTIFEFANVHGHISDARAALGQDVGSYGGGLYMLAVGSLLVLLGGFAETVRGRGR